MSGVMNYRVNRVWDSTIQVNVSAARYFWEWLNFVNDHPGLTVVEVGTGTTSIGSTIPAEWLSWDGVTDPTTLSPNALDPNSWLVFAAVNADPALAGGGGMPWQAKVQVAFGGTVYDDPSGTDYGHDGDTDVVVFRSSPAAGWTGSTTWNFVPGSGEETSPDMVAYEGQNKDFYLDLVGDDDTLFWKGATGDFPTDDPLTRSRSGYLGMINRRSASISWPFWMTMGKMYDATQGSGEGQATNSKRAATTARSVWAWDKDQWYWPSWSLGRDDTGVAIHRVDAWHQTLLSNLGPNMYTGDDVLPGLLLAELEPLDRYDILGELRFLVATDFSYGHHTVFGDNADLIQFCEFATSYSGIAMPWEPSTVPIW